MKQNGVEIESTLGLREAARVVNGVFGRAKATVEAISQSSNPLDGLDGQADLAVVGSRQGMLNQWAVQAYLTGKGSGTGITLIAVGDGAGSRMMAGARNSVSLSKSTEQMQQIIAALRAVDPGLREI